MKIQNSKTHFLRCLLMTGILSTIYLLVCALHHIYPFGLNTIDTTDFYDQLVPFYYHIHDMLNGSKSPFFDWNTGLGSNLAGLWSHYALLNPLHLLFGIIPRASIENFMTWYILLKFILIALSMYFFLAGNYSALPGKWMILMCLLYTFSGYTIQYYPLPMWLDTVALLPIVTHYLLVLLNKQKYLGFSLSLSAVFLVSLMQSYMFLIYIILFALTYTLLCVPKEKRPSAIYGLGIGTVIGILLSAFISLPGGLQIFSSARMNSELSFFKIYTTIDFTSRQKWLMITNLGIPFAFFAFVLWKQLKCLNKKFLFLTLMTVLLAFPVVFESTNLLWHMGSYVNFPMRFAYMLVFIIIIDFAESYSPFCESIQQFRLHRHLSLLKAAAFVLCLSCLPFSLYICQNNKGFLYIGFLFVLTALLTFTIFCICPLKTAGNSIITWSVILIFILCYGLFTFHTPDKLNYIPDSVELQSQYESYSPLSRVKNADSSLNNNYPFMMNQPAMSSYIHLVRPAQLSLANTLGYSQVWTGLRDTGGTVFSDALLNYRNTITATEQSAELYELEGTSSSYYMYKNHYSFSDGIILSGADTAQMPEEADNNPFHNQNALARLFIGENILNILEDNTLPPWKHSVEEKSILYFYGENLKNVRILVNGLPVTVPIPGNAENTDYAHDHNNGIIPLGIFENETVTVELKGNATDNTHCYLASCPVSSLQKYPASCAEDFAYTYGTDTLSVTLTNTFGGNSLLYLPLFADSGWQCTVNGKKTEIQTLFHALMLIPIESGTNVIEFRFTPPGYRMGIILTIIGIAALFAGHFLHSKLVLIPVLTKVSYVLFLLLGTAILISFYVIPVFAFIPGILL